MESVERGERRGGAVDPPGGGPPNLTTQIFATSGGGGTSAVARVPGDHSSFAICRFVYSVVPPGTASAGRSREVRGGGAGAGQSDRQGASFRRWEAARETPTSSSRSRSRAGDAPHVPHATTSIARAAIVPRGEAIEARVVISTPRTREVVARDAPRSARWVRANNGGARKLKKAHGVEWISRLYPARQMEGGDGVVM